jgi:hypothetical protein
MEDRALCRAPSRGIVHPPAQTAPAATAEATSAATADASTAAGEDTWCPRDHMHPWLWQPFRPKAWSPSQGWSPQVPSSPHPALGLWRRFCRLGNADRVGLQVWNSTPMFVPRILNLAKVKDALVQGETASGQAARARPPVSRWSVWSADMHIGPISDLKQVKLRARCGPTPSLRFVPLPRSLFEQCGTAMLNAVDDFRALGA